MTNQNDDLAHEIWAAAQTPPGDSIEGAVARINALLSKLRAPVADELVASLRRMASVAPASECEVLHAAANALASAPVAGAATYYAVMHGNALYGVFDSEAAAEACKTQGHPDAPFSVKPLYAAPQASEADGLIDALGQCRDAFPIPDKVGSKLDLLWQEAMSDPTAVPEYVKLCAALSAQPGAQRTGGSE